MESKRVKVTTDDLLDALKKALSQPEEGEGNTVAELCEATGASPEAVRKKIKTMIAEGRWEAIRVRRTDISGRTSIVPGYRPKQ